MILSALTGLLLAPSCLPFSIALAVLAGLGVVEVVALLLGGSLGGLFDTHAHDLHLDGAADGVEPGLGGKLLGWLHFGEVPGLVVLVCALAWFGLSGLSLQSLMYALFGSYLPTLSASGLALVSALPLTRISAGVLGRLLPRDETSAVSRTTFVGRVATMLQAPARRGEAAQAKLYDRFGQAHYVLVEPEEDGDVLEAGSEVLVVRQVGTRFTAIRNAHPALSRDPR